MTTIINVLGTGPPNPFVTLIQDLLASTPNSSAYSQAAAHLVTNVTTSADPVSEIWRLWDAFFRAVVASASTYGPHLAFLDALRAQPPTQPTNVAARSDEEIQLKNYTQTDGQLHWSKLPGFGWQWRDVHDVLEAHRDWDSVHASGPSDDPAANALGISGGEYYLRFCRFSAAFLKATNGKDQVHPVEVFYICRNVLESKGPKPRKEEAHRLTAEQLWALDVHAAATWLLDGGRALWETDHKYLREHWGKSLDWKTELWPREDGLTPERWRLWKERLRTLSNEDGCLNEETRALAIEAADVVKSILEERSI